MSNHQELITETMILPTGMELTDTDLHHFVISVRWMGPRTGGDRSQGGWSVTTLFDQLSRAEKWSRGYVDHYQKWQYRWETREEALELAHKYVDRVKVNGRTFAEWQTYLKENTREH